MRRDEHDVSVEYFLREKGEDRERRMGEGEEEKDERDEGDDDKAEDEILCLIFPFLNTWKSDGGKEDRERRE